MTFVMWAVMMVGMMLPGAAPMILLFATINRRKSATGGPFVPTTVFVLGYLAVWTAYAAAATLVQWALHDAALLSPAMAASSTALGGALFLAAGAFQLTPLKHACLENCRSPLDFIMTRWSEGHAGALRTGVAHGAYCLGCCWAVMCLLFVGGIMNLAWVAAIAFFVVAEKIAPRGAWLARVSGVGMAGFGAYLLLRFVVAP